MDRYLLCQALFKGIFDRDQPVRLHLQIKFCLLSRQYTFYFRLNLEIG